MAAQGDASFNGVITRHVKLAILPLLTDGIVSHATFLSCRGIPATMRCRSSKVGAYELAISPRTIEIHRANIMGKMHARSFSEVVRIAIAADHAARPSIWPTGLTLAKVARAPKCTARIERHTTSHMATAAAAVEKATAPR